MENHGQIHDSVLIALSITIKKTLPDLSKYLTDILFSGEMVFSVLGLTDIRGVKNVTTAISEGLYELGSQNDVSCLDDIYLTQVSIYHVYQFILLDCEITLESIHGTNQY